MPSTARKFKIRTANQELILAAAEREFGSFGYKGATTERIARAAGLPKANVHYYFKTKSNIYRLVLKRILDDWMAAATTFDSTQDPERALTRYVAAKMDFSRKRPYGSKVWAKEIMNGAPVMEGFLGTTLKNWVDERIQCIEGWIRDSKIQPVDPRSFLYMIWATTQHYADFEHQILILNDDLPATDILFAQRTTEVTRLILNSVGLYGNQGDRCVSH